MTTNFHNHMTDHQQQHRPDTINWLTEELRLRVSYVEDPELKARVLNWLQTASKAPSGSVMDHVETKLSQARRDDSGEHPTQFEMRRVDGDGAANFPDSCEGCPHYGVRCPVFVDPDEQDRRERLQDEFAEAPPDRVEQAYRRYGEQNDCHQILTALTDWSEGFEEIVVDGLELYKEVEGVVDVGLTDEEAEAQRIVDDATGVSD